MTWDIISLFSVFLAILIFSECAGDDGYFWHVTDMHWDPTYRLDSRAFSCPESSDTQPSWGIYGDYLCDAPWALINSSVYAMKEINPDVDFLIWTG